MRNFIKTLIAIPVIVIVVVLFLNSFDFVGTTPDFKVFSCLVAGYDTAAENTDVLFVFSYNRDTNQASFLQIPRDSFCKFNGEYGKINRIFTLSSSMGTSKDESMALLKRNVEEYLGTELDGYVGLSMDALVRFVDTVGGVYINVPESFPFESFPIKLSPGKNLLSGADAKLFVRHRASYISADLGRIDSQKIFLEGVFHTVFERLDARDIIKLITTKDKEVVVDLPFGELVSLVLKRYGDIKSAEITLLTLPGEAYLDKGVSYYVINRSAATDAVKRYLYSDSVVFDPEYRLTDKSNRHIESIYTKTDFSYKVFTNGKTVEINIK